MSEPLVERLNRITAAQHRKRNGLIQHILSEYEHAHSDEARRQRGP
jgi:hypothetical protein